MRIAVVYSYRRKIGGIETYLDTVITELVNAGHSLSYWFEIGDDSGLEQISLPKGVPAWCVEEIGAKCALELLREWKPDLIYSHGLLDPRLEHEVLEIGPAVIFVHGYYGTCISGNKAFKRPVVTPCDKRFGWRCLLNYHPRGCGGWNPLTMMTDYSIQSTRLKALRKYRAIITGSEHMRAEFIRNGLGPEKIFNVALPVPLRDLENGMALHGLSPEIDLDCSTVDSKKPVGFTNESKAPEIATTAHHWRLLFVGRMVRLKGGGVFLDALPKVRASTGKALRVIFAGDGPERGRWERKAKRLSAQDDNLEIEFLGWQRGEHLEAILLDSDLLVVPSVWPEPFGLVGPEAGLRGVPAVAFRVGGITTWLTDGMNGYTAPADPPTAAGLAEAIIKCLHNPTVYLQLRRGAVTSARRFNASTHVASLQAVFEKAVQ
jgi:glycosyltransferase involved in cell wall biosynthesis